MFNVINRKYIHCVRAKTEHIEHVISVSRNDPRNCFQLLVNRFQLLVDVL